MEFWRKQYVKMTSSQGIQAENATKICFSLIVPVYNNEASLGHLLDEIDEIAVSLPGKLEVIFVVDGSPDQSYAILAKALPSRQWASRLLALSRNFGSFSAIIAGLTAGTGNYFACMAADLQDPPETIQEFFQTLHSGKADIALGVRAGRADPWLSRQASSIFWWLYRHFVQPDMPPGGFDIFGCSKLVRDQLVQLQERNSTLVGLLLWLGYRRSFLPYTRRHRPHGHSAWGFARKLQYMFDSAFAFTRTPLRLLVIIGAGGLFFSIIYLMIVCAATLTGHISQPGFPTLAGLIVIFGTGNLLATGLLGSYSWRTFENTKQRPRYIVMGEIVNDGTASPPE